MRIGDILVQHHQIRAVDIDRALKFQSQYGGRLGNILINMGIISEDTLVAALSHQLNLPVFADIDRDQLNFSTLELPDGMGMDFLVRHQWLPLAFEEGHGSFAAVDPLDMAVNQLLGDLDVTGTVHLVTETQFRELQGDMELARVTDDTDTLGKDLSMSDTEVDKLRELASEAPIVNLVNRLIARAVLRGASDLHFEPYKDMYRVRFRIDGLLHDIDFLPVSMQLPIASRIKILSGMDIAERRRPQDGQITMKVASRELDIRVSTLPLADGESLVLRFLIKESVSYSLDHLGLSPDLVTRLTSDIKKTAGVILLTGPTGSGKTTTLYSCLNAINSEDKKIVTIEDPVEYRLDGINQIQVHPDIGYDFLHALRSILRQDPDVIMVGEIRDPETARAAMQSSLTGHLVFSTLHTNDAPSTYTRLIDLGLPEYLINSSLISVIAQRLVRRLCKKCAEPDPNAEAVIEAHGFSQIAQTCDENKLHPCRPTGCKECNHTGYAGRVSIMEYLQCTPHIKSLPKDSGFPSGARQYMADNGIRSLFEDGCLKYLQGITSMDEVLRVAG
jgi:general secretion pathway protein E